MTSQRFQSFAEFYPFYLAEHSDPRCRRCHFAGSMAVLMLLAASAAAGNIVFLLVAPFVGYGSAWIGHFVFEKNRPATFKHPVYSLIGDWVMFRDILAGRVSI